MNLRQPLRVACCVAAMTTAVACSKSNNLILGEVRATVGSHSVVVTDCYRTSVPAPQKLNDGYRFTPCRDADVSIHDEALTVNGTAYGHLYPGDSIMVDHGVVSLKRLQVRNNLEK
jgi:hypothetical protein